jgi:hypothetical protein
MFKRHLDSVRQMMRTPACVRGRHAECPHLFGFGTGFNLSKLRPDLGVSLCACDCHASCPVSDDKQLAALLVSVTARTWRESCTCPGADAERSRWEQEGFEPADTDEVWDRSRQRQQSIQEAFDAAKAQAAGKSREQIRELYLAELHARGQQTPQQEALDATVAAIAGNPLPTARIMGRAVIDLVKSFRGIHF